jgi:hypothetical protein
MPVRYLLEDKNGVTPFRSLEEVERAPLAAASPPKTPSQAMAPYERKAAFRGNLARPDSVCVRDGLAGWGARIRTSAFQNRNSPRLSAQGAGLALAHLELQVRGQHS